VLGIDIGSVLVYIEGGGVLVGFVESIVLIAILGGKRWWEALLITLFIHPYYVTSKGGLIERIILFPQNSEVLA